MLLGGEGPDRVSLEPALARAGYIIAADSGFDLAVRLDLRPDLLIGDFDSVSASVALAAFPADRVRRYPRDKDETDAELGLRLFRELGYDRVVLAGGGGGRLDHLLALVGLFEREAAPAAWYTAREQVQSIDRELELVGCLGQTVSLFALGDGAVGMHSEGLKWPLDGLEWGRGQGGVSNLFVEDRARIRVKKGRLLMVRTLKGA